MHLVLLKNRKINDQQSRLDSQIIVMNYKPVVLFNK